MGGFMCWSGEASTVVAAIGLASTAYAASRREPAPLWLALGYFSLMEALQAFTYTVIDDCTNPANQIATLLGYIHIAFQPFFGNCLFMHFIPDEIRRRIQIPVYALCAISSVVMIIQLYPFSWAGVCNLGNVLCSHQLCSVSGQWHIAWDLPYNAIGEIDYPIPVLNAGFFTYTLTMFVLQALYGSWRMTLYHIVLGPLPARLLTDDLNEFAAIWCLVSIGFLLIVAKTPIRRILYVRSWPLWPRRLCARPAATAAE
ncbi:MAG: DUF5765 domain-containing protein [Rhodospirillales bacterium]|nr:DUF5765 domain-containing protein [Rhodospirillales bacterium]